MSSPAATAKAARLQAKQNAKSVTTSAKEAPKSELALLKKSAARKNKFPKKELIKFCRGMGSMLKAQINTADALRFYSQGHPNKFVQKTLLEIRQTIDAGAPAYVAFAKTKKFDDKFISLVRAGTDSGQLDEAFTAISHRLKKEADFNKKLKKATVLPSIIIVVLMLLFVVAQTKIVPQVQGMLADVGQEPDPFSQIMFKISEATRKVWPYVFAVLFTVAMLIFNVKQVSNAVLNLAMSKWRLLRRMVMSLRQMLFLGTLNMLHSNGITLAKSVEIASTSVKGTPMYSELIEAGEKYQKTGLPFSESLRKFTSCDAQVAHMVSIGERSSSLGTQLSMLTDMYEEDVDQMINDFAAAINFVTLVMACLLIAAVFIGAFLPIFLMGPKMMNGSM